jgi:hypothetical protein
MLCRTQPSSKVGQNITESVITRQSAEEMKLMERKLFRHLFVFTFLLTQAHYLIQNAAAQAAQAELTGEVRDQTGIGKCV